MTDQGGTHAGPAGPDRLDELLQFQDGAVVSRVLLKNGGGNDTLFAFAEDEGLSEHTAPFDAYVLGLEGEAEIAVEGSPFRVTEGQALLLPARRPHAVRALTPFKMLVVLLRA